MWLYSVSTFGPKSLWNVLHEDYNIGGKTTSAWCISKLHYINDIYLDLSVGYNTKKFDVTISVSFNSYNPIHLRSEISEVT